MREESTHEENRHEDNTHEDNTHEDETREGKKRKHMPQKHSCAPPTYQESTKPEYSIHDSRPVTPSMQLFSSNNVDKQTFLQHKSAQDQFMTICSDVMKNVENGLLERSSLLALDSESENSKKRKFTLASDSIRNVTTILFAANKLLYSATKKA